jgi:hypothetical protein
VYKAVPRDEYFGREDVCTGPLGVIGLGGDAERGSCPGQADNGDRHDDGGDWRAKLVGLEYDEQRQRRGDDVADDGKDPDQRIQAEAQRRCRDDERGVEQGRKRLDPGNAGPESGGAASHRSRDHR